MASNFNQKNFNLTSFNSHQIPSIQISGNISRHKYQLELRYVLTGDLSTIIIPPQNHLPLRQYDLWEHTCCEFFLKPQNRTEYWEFNLAPSGNWNIFYFPDYRQNITEESAFTALPFKILLKPQILELSIQIDLANIGIANQDLEIAITSVIENQKHQLSYWALAHPASEPDFHAQAGFKISL